MRSSWRTSWSPCMGSLLLVYVEVVMAPPGPDSDPRWQLDDRRRGLERLASVRDDAGLDAELLTVQASSVAGACTGGPPTRRPARDRRVEAGRIRAHLRRRRHPAGPTGRSMRGRCGAHGLRGSGERARHDRGRLRRLPPQRACARRGE